MTLHRRICLAAAAIAAALAGHASSGAAAPKPRCTVATKPRTIAYERVAGVRPEVTSLDVWTPGRCLTGKARAPVVMFVHGGSYRRGDKGNKVTHKVRLFNARGWIFVSVNYRLTGSARSGAARYPDHYRDVAAAVAWTNAHVARFHGDPHRVALLGHSAGADIVSNVTTNPRWLRERRLPLGAVRCAGDLDTAGYDKTRATGAEATQWKLALGNDPRYLIDTSATRLVRRGIGIPKSIVVVRGTPRRRAIETAFVRRLRAAGIPASVIEAGSLSHEQVNTRIGAPGDTVMTPPLTRFLAGCFARG